jgi:hypothetical protein
MPSDWERVGADPALLAALRRHHAGAGDPLDQLWWVEHPGERTPAGLADPAREVESARRALFQRDADPGAAAEVERAATTADADRRSALLALAAADAERASAPPAAAGPRAGRPARRVLAGAAVAPLVIGAGAGYAAGRFLHGPAPAAFAVFDRAQRADDRPPSIADLPDAVVRASTRLLGSSTASGTALYAARTRDDRVCLLAVVLAERVIGSCASDAAFADSGLSLTFPTTVDPTDDSGVPPPQELSPEWSPEGRLTF